MNKSVEQEIRKAVKEYMTKDLFTDGYKPGMAMEAANHKMADIEQNIINDLLVVIKDEVSDVLNDLIAKDRGYLSEETCDDEINKRYLPVEKLSLDEKISIANNQKSEICFAGYPSLEKIKSDYNELMDKIKDVRTVDDAKRFSDENSIVVEINGVSIDDFLRDGGTDKDIDWIRYEEFGCLSYVYDRFDGRPMFDVSVDDDFYEFITDIRIDEI